MARRHDPKGRSASPEHWTKMLRPTMETDAWRALSTTAQALYPWLKMEWKGPNANNNGKIRLSVRQAAERMGVNIKTAGRAFAELQAKGFIVQTERARLGTTGAARSAAYEITELGLPYGDKPEGRKLYREWQVRADFPVHRASPNNPSGRNKKTESHAQNWDVVVPITGTKRRQSCPK